MNGTPVVIYNPVAGRGRARRQREDLQSRLPVGASLIPTSAPGNAAGLAQTAICHGARWLIAAGGDGTMHEVANGILVAGNPNVLFTPLPLGSMNDFAYSLGILDWWKSGNNWHSLQTMMVDVGMIRGGRSDQYFVNCCGIGFNGMVTIEARKIRWLTGVPLYILAVLKALMKHFNKPYLKVTVDGLESERHTLAYTLGLGQREGGFPLTANARLDDNLFDSLQVGAVRRWELVRYLPAMISGRLPRDHPHLHFGTGRHYQFESPIPLCIHLDGEFYCRPEDDVRQIEITLLPKQLNVTYDPRYLYGRH